jgi:hypothetical protein
LGVVVALLAVAVAFAVGRSGNKKTSSVLAPGEILLEPAASKGPDPFTPSSATGPTTGPALTVPTTAASTTTTTKTASPPTAQALVTKTGTAPGLYGGTQDQHSCDSQLLISFLQQHPDKGAAWAKVEGITVAQIPSYIGGLTSTVLRADTRVTNHGFRNGVATAHQSVLQAGTAVLVDSSGVPRARCACGNPLLAPQAITGTRKFVGTAWKGFKPDALQAVTPGPPTNNFVMTDVRNGATFSRPVGATAGPDTQLTPPTISGTTAGSSTTLASPTTSTTASSTETTLSSDIPPPNADATKEGTVTASSSDPGHTPQAAVDGDTTTTWSASGFPAFAWTGTHDDNIVSVKLVGVSGFTSVTVQVLDATGDVDFKQKVTISSSDVEVKPGVQGRSVGLSFEGSGQVAELRIGVFR